MPVMLHADALMMEDADHLHDDLVLYVLKRCMWLVMATFTLVDRWNDLLA